MFMSVSNVGVLETSSFRDPSGFIFMRGHDVYRQVNQSYCGDYRALMEGGLYEALVERSYLVSHEEVAIEYAVDERASYVIRPQKIPFITYPYEWSFSQLKDAALLVLETQLLALSRGMSLKDASAYNVQFYRGSPILIDTLSFVPYLQGPWVAYRQFCEHFVAPLVLMAYRDVGLQRLLQSNIDGIPLSLASKLLPFRALINYRIFMHIKMHAGYMEKLDGAESSVRRGAVDRVGGLSKQKLIAMVEDLKALVEGLSLQVQSSQWSEYYLSNSYSDKEMEGKEKVVRLFLSDMTSMLGSELISIQDFGANDGRFSRLAKDYCSVVVSHDIDGVAVEGNYLRCLKECEEKILPVVTDLANPSPGIGWKGKERKAFCERFVSDAGMALALTHHLAIRHHISFSMQAEFFSTLCRFLIVEFIPKSDEQVKRLLLAREDVFVGYDQDSFELMFSKYYCIVSSQQVTASGRVLYLMKRKDMIGE